MKDILKNKSYQFSLNIISLTRKLNRNQSEWILSKQLMRSGTAIGALIREAEFAQSRKDFISKMSITLKEANETVYWLDLLKDSKLIKIKVHNELQFMNKELIAMLVATVKTTKSKI